MTLLTTLIVIVTIVSLFSNKTACNKHFEVNSRPELSYHTFVSDVKIYPYVAAILQKSEYLCAGALINDMWVLTTAVPIVTVRESLRTIHVRLGSVNCKKGGILIPSKYFETHPNFDDHIPAYDLALVMLAEVVPLSKKVTPVHMQLTRKRLTSSHVTVTSWLSAKSKKLSKQIKSNKLKSLKAVQRFRILTVSHQQPMESGSCSKELHRFDMENTGAIKCLKTPMNADPCRRDVGAPVTQNGVLIGIVSSWAPKNCNHSPAPSFIVKLSNAKISTWINSTTKEQEVTESKMVSDGYASVSSDEDSSI